MSDPTTKEPTDAFIVQAPKDIYADRHVIDDSLLGKGTRFNITERVETPPEGGIYAYLKGIPFPRKGLPTPENCWANDNVKRVMVFLLRSLGTKDMLLPGIAFAIIPWSWKLRTMNRMLFEFSRIGCWLLQGAFLKPHLYSNPTKPLQKGVAVFLKDVGIQERTSDDVAKIIATVLEYDDAYRYRFEDIMSCTERHHLVASPVREVRRLIDIFRAREKYTDMMSKLDAFEAIASLALMHPRIRRSFKKAVIAIRPDEFQMLKMDEADRYHTLLRGDYDFGGKPIELRMKRYALIHTFSLCCGAPVFIFNHDHDGLACTKCRLPCRTERKLPPEVTVDQ